MRLLILMALLVARPAAAVLLDGDGSEHPLVADDRADGGLLALTASFGEGLWIGLEFENEVEADGGSGLVLHLDADGDPSTGDRDGCELVFDLQARHGSLHPPREIPGSGRLFERLGLVVAPTFASTRAEVYLPASDLLGERVRFFVVHGPDRAPDTGSVEVSRGSPLVVAPIDLSPPSGTLRIASWNVEHDGFFDLRRAEALRRILAAIEPDVLVVCEVFNHSGAEMMSRAGELGIGAFGFVEKADPGNVVLSRYPITASWSILDGPARRNGQRVSAVMIDAPAGPFLVIPAHWSCCRKESKRLLEADATVAFLRDAFTPGGNFTFDAELPFLICGDLNLVTSRRPLDVLLTGSVVDKDGFAPDFPAGPGRTPLSVVPLRHSHAPFTFTWRPQGTKYYAGRLDWVIAPSGVVVAKGFVLDTATMPPAALTASGLQADDSARASDHAPVVVDVRW